MIFALLLIFAAHRARAVSITPMRTYGCHLPRTLLGKGGSPAGGDSARSAMTAELWWIPQRAHPAPTDSATWRREGVALYVASSGPGLPGDSVTITVPDTLGPGAAWFQARGPAGLCPIYSNLVASHK